MANPASLQKRDGKYLWFSLLGMGFQPDSAISLIGKTSANMKRINLGPNMFDKPNRDAFHMVTHFLLDRLNPARFSETYRYCWPVVNPKSDAEFRKVTCSWLREIVDESVNEGFTVVASLFLSPGGPKFTSLMLNLANHVMLQEMKTFCTEDSWVPEAAALPASSLHRATKRLEMVNKRFLSTAREQDRFLHEYQTRAQLLVKSMRELRAEGSKYEELLRRHGDASSQDGGSSAEKIKQVRSLWSTIEEMVSIIKAEQDGVECVLQGEVDQYVLDGTDRVLNVPRVLQQQVEQLPQLSSGRLYESGQLNLLCVLELMNHSLRLLREERRHLCHTPIPDLRPAQLQDTSGQMSRALQSLQLIRQKISKEGIPEVRSCIQELEASWDRKWSEELRDSPLAAFLEEEQAVGFLSPMAPLSFDPVTEAGSSVFSQFPARLLGELVCVSEEEPQEVESSCSHLSSLSPEAAVVSRSPVPVETAPSRANTSLDWLFDTPPSPSLRTPVPQVSVKKPTEHLRTETQILELECENLADQFADAVAAPSEGRVRGLDLEALLSTLHTDPFSTRKQLPRTPESLISDVKSSWRRAVEEDEVEKLGPVVLDRSNGGAPARQQEAPSHTLPSLWDTLATEAADSPSGAGSSGVQFSLDWETLPSCDSLLSLDESDLRSEDGSFLKDRGTHRDSVGNTETVFSPGTGPPGGPHLITFSPSLT